MRCLAWFVTIVTLSLASAPPAHADNREEARKAFAEGQAADKQSDWPAAVEHYLHAFELVPHHFAAFNIATDYERMNQLREAATWYQRYVELAPQSPDRDKVQRLILELKLRPARLTVKSTPPGARLSIDGQKVGITPYTGSVRGGGHRITVELDGQRDERDVPLEFGEPETVELTLRGARGAGGSGNSAPSGSQGVLIVRGSPQGAMVSVDDAPLGTVPLSMPVDAGTHKIKVTSYGYTPFESTEQIAAGKPTPIDVKLEQGGLGSTPSAAVFQLGYLIGGGAGADVRGDGAALMGEFGLRASQYDLSVRIGKAAGFTVLDLLVRWALLKSRLSPTVGAGYSYTFGKSTSGTSSSSSTSGSGWEVSGGLRYDLTRTTTVSMALLAEFTARSYSAIETGTGARSGWMFPFLVSYQITVGRQR